MALTLFTFGYRGLRCPHDLAALLYGKGIRQVIDIRLSPQSSNPVWSTPTVRSTVEEAGFEYRHYGGLGNRGYKSGFIAIADIEQVEVLAQLMAAGMTVALMCACRRYEECHRKVVAEELRRRYSFIELVEVRLSQQEAPVQGGLFESADS